MLIWLDRYILPAAHAVLPPAMFSTKANAMLLAIALQESGVSHRRQVGGPARGFWQFELRGVSGVRRHVASREQLRAALKSLQYPDDMPSVELHAALEHNDVLACVVARLLLWTLPQPLPDETNAEEGWMQYLAAWRPGRPHERTWLANFATAWDVQTIVPASVISD